MASGLRRGSNGLPLVPTWSPVWLNAVTVPGLPMKLYPPEITRPLLLLLKSLPLRCPAMMLPNTKVGLMNASTALAPALPWMVERSTLALACSSTSALPRLPEIVLSSIRVVLFANPLSTTLLSTEPALPVIGLPRSSSEPRF